MAQFTEPVAAMPLTALNVPRSPSRTLWRVGGGLALAHVVLLFAGFSQEVAVEHGDAPAVIQKIYGGANLTRVLAGGYVEAMSFVVLAAAVVIIARLFGHRTEAGRTAAQTFLALGVVFVASTLAVGFPPGAAAVYAAHNGADPATISIVNDIRNYGYILQVALQMAMALSLGVAALAEKQFTRWVGWFGAVLGGAGIVLVPFAHDVIGMVWMIWWVGVAVLLLRASRTGDGASERIS